MTRWQLTERRLALFPPVIALTLAGSTGLAFAQNGDAVAELFGILVLLTVLLGVFFVPSLVAFAREHPNRWPIFLVNLLFGATGLGWLGSLIWALNAVHRPAGGGTGGASGLNIFEDDAQPAYRPSLTVPSVTDFTRLKELLDQGAIDRTEYDQIKRRLLFGS